MLIKADFFIITNVADLTNGKIRSRIEFPKFNLICGIQNDIF